MSFNFKKKNIALLQLLQIEDLSQQVHKAAAEKFKVPLDPSPLTPDIIPSLTIKEESEEEEEVERADTVYNCFLVTRLPCTSLK